MENFGSHVHQMWLLIHSSRGIHEVLDDFVIEFSSPTKLANASAYLIFMLSQKFSRLREKERLTAMSMLYLVYTGETRTVPFFSWLLKLTEKDCLQRIERELKEDDGGVIHRIEREYKELIAETSLELLIFQTIRTKLSFKHRKVNLKVLKKLAEDQRFISEILTHGDIGESSKKSSGGIAISFDDMLRISEKLFYVEKGSPFFLASEMARCTNPENCFKCSFCGFLTCCHCHSVIHWEESGHVFAIQLATERCWDFRKADWVDMYVEGGMPKTEACKRWKDTHRCKFGEACLFAHGSEELQPVVRSNKYKTKPCNKGGYCPYGDRCQFRHG